MKLEEIRTISVLGAGIMGHGIAQSFLMGGYPVWLYDIEESILETAKGHIEKNLQIFYQAGFVGKGDIEPILSRLSTTTDLKHAVERSDFITEAAPEDLSLKQGLFQRVESLCGNDTIMATNTSSLSLKDIGARVKSKERLVITHWLILPTLCPRWRW